MEEMRWRRVWGLRRLEELGMCHLWRSEGLEEETGEGEGVKLRLRNLTNDLPGRAESERIFQGFSHLNPRTPSEPLTGVAALSVQQDCRRWSQFLCAQIPGLPPNPHVTSGNLLGLFGLLLPHPQNGKNGVPTP